MQPATGSYGDIKPPFYSMRQEDCAAVNKRGRSDVDSCRGHLAVQMKMAYKQSFGK